MRDRLELLRELRAQRITKLWLMTSAVLLLVLALAGLLMRGSQATGGSIDQQHFYELLSLHGTGMIGVGLPTIAAVYWFVMKDALPLSVKVMRFSYVLTVVGVVVIIVAVLFGGYTSAWTFLYPLPESPGSESPSPALAGEAFLVGLALVVAAFAAWCIDFLRAAIARFGSLSRVLGFDLLSGEAQPGPDTTDPSVIAGTVVTIAGLSACLTGATIVALMLGGLIEPSFRLNALLAKNMIYFTGHTLANIQIYLAAGVAYSILPTYASRPWKASRVLVVGWLATLAIIMLAFFHHLYQDFAQPEAVQLVGNIASYAAGIPPMVVTIFGAMLLVYRSGLRWSAAPLFLFLAFAGWAIGGYAAVIDSTPALNQLFHNTLWVPAHFHTYMAMGVMFFMLGGVYHIVPRLTGLHMSEARGRLAAALMAVGGYGLVTAWYLGGALGNPRRYAVPLPGLDPLAWMGFAFAIVAVLGMLIVFGDFMRVVWYRAGPVYLPLPKVDEVTA